MFRSAAVAVLALALSSSAAFAQTAPDGAPDVDIIWLLQFELSIEAPPELEARAFTSLAEFAVPAGAAGTGSMSMTQPTFAERVELLWANSVGRTHDILGTAREHVSSFVAAARQEPRLVMHVTHGTLQLLDLVSTSKALAAGHREANPLFENRGIASMALAKTAAVGLQIFAVERLAKTRPQTAKWVMVATNALMSIVVANNFMVGGGDDGSLRR